MTDVNVIGLGYIGLPTALMMAAHGIRVTGTDRDRKLVETLNAGQATFREGGLGELFQKAAGAGIRFADSCREAEVYIISVPTPYDRFTKKVNAAYVVEAVREALEAAPQGATVVIESTVRPEPLINTSAPWLCGWGSSPEKTCTLPMRRRGLSRETCCMSWHAITGQSGRTTRKPGSVCVPCMHRSARGKLP